MRPLTEDQLSMLLSDAEVPSGMTFDDLDTTGEQTNVLIGIGWLRVCADRDYTEELLDWLRNNGLVPCGYCLGTGETRGLAYTGPYEAFMRRYICTHCEGTGVAR